MAYSYPSDVKRLDIRKSIKVFCRVRPFEQIDEQPGEASEFQFRSFNKNGQVHGLVLAGSTLFTLNGGVLGPDADQRLVYRHVLPAVGHACSGQTGTIITYGGKGAGKTYTIRGNQSTEGIFQMAISDIFEAPTDQRTVTLEYYEVCGDQMRNLLPVNKQQTVASANWAAPSAASSSSTQSGLRGKQFHTKEELFKAVANASELLDPKRSHIVFKINIHNKKDQENRGETNGTLLLVDLASRLSALDEIFASTEKSIATLLPKGKEETKLTELLQNALVSSDPNQRRCTAIVVCCSSAAVDEPATRASLLFAERVQSEQYVYVHGRSHEISRKRPFSGFDAAQEDDLRHRQHVRIGQSNITAQDQMKYKSIWMDGNLCRSIPLNENWAICRPLENQVPHREHVFFRYWKKSEKKGEKGEEKFVWEWDGLPEELKERPDVKMMYEDATLMRHGDFLLKALMHIIRGESIDDILIKDFGAGARASALAEEFRKAELFHSETEMVELNIAKAKGEDNRQRTDCCNYLLLDPRYLKDMDNPGKASFLEFCNAIFYIGEGNPKLRPFAHAKDAKNKVNTKTRRIRDIWKCDGYGVLTSLCTFALPKNQVRINEACLLKARYTYEWPKTEATPLTHKDGIDLCNERCETWQIEGTVAQNWNGFDAETTGLLLLMQAYRIFISMPTRPILEQDMVLEESQYGWSSGCSTPSNASGQRSGSMSSPHLRGGSVNWGSRSDSMSSPHLRGGSVNRGFNATQRGNSNSSYSRSASMSSTHSRGSSVNKGSYKL